MLERLKAKEGVIESDAAAGSTQATAGSSAPLGLGGPEAEQLSGADAKAANTKTVSVTKEIARLEMEARNPRDAALEHLRRFEVVEDFQVGGSARVRVAPHMIARLYCSGRTAVREMEEFIKSRGLDK